MGGNQPGADGITEQANATDRPVDAGASKERNLLAEVLAQQRGFNEGLAHLEATISEYAATGERNRGEGDRDASASPASDNPPKRGDVDHRANARADMGRDGGEAKHAAHGGIEPDSP